MESPNHASNGSTHRSLPTEAVRILLLDDEPINLHLRATILQRHGYHCVPVANIEQAIPFFDVIDIAIFDYHLGSGEFGTEAATILRRRRPHVPILILSAELDRFLGGVEDIHLLKGHCSVDELLDALKSLEIKRHGYPAIVDARDFFYSRISTALGAGALVQIFDQNGIWQYCNDTAADYLQQPHDWFTGRCLFDEMPTLMRDWRDVIQSVCLTRETYVDRTHRGLLDSPRAEEQNLSWSVLAFPITLHDNRTGAVLTARVLERSQLHPSGPPAVSRST
jgi:two-component system OmpR family response regulator